MSEIADRRVGRYLKREADRLVLTAYEEQRREKSVTRKAARLVKGILAGLVAGRNGFEEMEKLTENLSTEIRKVLDIPGRIPDNTANYFAGSAHVEGIRSALRAQAKAAYRRKSLQELGPHAPIGMVSADGKYPRAKVKLNKKLSLDENVRLVRERYPFFQPDEAAKDGWLWGEVRTLSVTHVSGRATTYLDCVPVRGETNEMGTFVEMFEALKQDWGQTDLFELFAVDAGMVSLKHATMVDEQGWGYLMAIKGSQPDLHAELTRQLAGRSAKSADAILEERYRGSTVTWRIWRTQDMAAWGNWSHIRQGIRIERTTVPDAPSKDTTVEQRYYVSNVPWNRLDHEQWIWAIRCHWRVENNAHWVLDMIFNEDKRPWTRNPHGMLAMVMLRRIAFNLVSLFRGVYLRSEEYRAMPWKDVIEPFYDTMRTAKLEHLLRSRDLQRSKIEAA